MSTAKPLVVITGASSGIGLASARAFAANGHPLLLLARHFPPETRLDGARCVEADVADAEAVRAAIAQGEAEFGPVDCLVNNAGVADARPFDAVTPTDFEREIRTNLLGTMNAAHAVFAGMVARQAGTIINVTSVSDRKTCPVALGYTASKFGARAFSESLREAGAMAGVRVINIAPGYIRTNIHAGMGITFDEYRARLGNPDFMTADELAAIIRHCYDLPPHLCVRDLVITPTRTGF